jgi:hypothetical protein
MRTHQKAAAATTVAAAAGPSRYNELKKMLEGRRHELQAEVQGKMRDVHPARSQATEVFDAGEPRERHPGSHRAALIQLKAETLNKATTR